MANCAIVGINWGDEGKGRMVDLLTEDYDVVVRFQGGGNAGHTVINDKGKFALHLLPSGIFREGVVNILGNGVALDPENLWREIEDITASGVEITQNNLKISDRASLLLPWHRDMDELEEKRLADKKYGSTRQGIAPFYSDKYQKKTVLAGEMFYPEALKSHLLDIMEWKNLILTKVYGAKPYTEEMLDEWLMAYCEKLKPFICDTGEYLKSVSKGGKKILFEAQLGSLRDLDYGIYPYTTSSNTTAAYAPIGSGFPGAKIDRVLGIVKAYSTCVGEGPFVSEMFGEEADKLREAGGEYGAKTGRPRRVGAFDVVATAYGIEVQAATEIAVTKLDVLSSMEKIPVCTAYMLDGKRITRFPFPAALKEATPVIGYFDGWMCDISGVREWDKLPQAARDYVSFIEKSVGCRVSYVSVGPERESIIIKHKENEDMTNQYESPLSSRYASEYMLGLFSSDTRYQTYASCGSPCSGKAAWPPYYGEQVSALESHITDIDYECVKQREREVRHDVMAHIDAYGKAAPDAAGIIHLGATSCYVTDNADIVIYRDALRYLRAELLKVLANLADFAEKYKAVPTLGYTHYQPAQLVTVGKRAALWLQDFMSDLEETDFVLANMKFLGCRGTTGTEASFVELFDGDTAKIDEMNRLIADDFGFAKCYSVCSQTYPRKLDSRILHCLSAVAQSCYKMANDIRLLQHDRQLEEPFEKNQIGSSAMAYKRNPMRCERICSLARYLMSDAANAAMTASVQWLERTLDDSANRRISMPEGFLCADAILRLAQNVTDGLHVNEKIIEKTVREYLPFIATENLMMEAVKRGGDRQQIHEVIRTCSMRATSKMKNGGECDLLRLLSEEPEFGLTEAEMKELLKPEKYIGRCAEQVEHYLAEVKPIISGIDRKTVEIAL